MAGPFLFMRLSIKVISKNLEAKKTSCVAKKPGDDGFATKDVGNAKGNKDGHNTHTKNGVQVFSNIHAILPRQSKENAKDVLSYSLLGYMIIV